MLKNQGYYAQNYAHELTVLIGYFDWLTALLEKVIVLSEYFDLSIHIEL